ncbi:MAG: DNA translocase FtsK, partial [Butyrivibrio sp.]|nr:DNA translocase FtsK [Butyrivibrio sp.]
IESDEFRNAESHLSVAIGKDIAGKIVVTDIGKMPHLLIAGATGSGKSVCINTVIMSLLYKASPEDVRMIMIDPKIVELSVYNGIPHLLIPVVTDPKKAAAALAWAVNEMTNRYKKFADAKVRDLAGYNALCDHASEEEGFVRMPEIVVIVDELADLMMQFTNEVEDSIVRLTQLARAAGIYLIIATQRPSVDVITGLIKANIPSRIAFAVSSGVDSRTILDSYGAEKLIGKGDMLFFPRGYNKPARVQGAFVSDDEVQRVTDFVREQVIETSYGVGVQEEMSAMEPAAGGKGGAQSAAAAADAGMSENGSVGGYDEYFEQAGRFIIEKDKASIGMLQRAYKIGFNRAARIMDQLCEAGVVADEEGTKPRRILMSMEQFEKMVEELKNE